MFTKLIFLTCIFWFEGVAECFRVYSLLFLPPLSTYGPHLEHLICQLCLWRWWIWSTFWLLANLVPQCCIYPTESSLQPTNQPSWEDIRAIGEYLKSVIKKELHIHRRFFCIIIVWQPKFVLSKHVDFYSTRNKQRSMNRQTIVR